MNTILALRGKGNSGKSVTIRMLHDLLLQNGYQSVRSNLRLSGDFVAVFSKNGILIGVTSSGDTYDAVHNNLQNLINDGCEICVCTCRTFDRVPPGTNAAIIEFSTYRNQFIEKTLDNSLVTQNATNMSDVQRLLTEIEKLII